MQDWQNQFHALLELGKTTLARRLLQDVARSDPGNPQLLLSAALLNGYEEKYPEAERDVTEFLRVEPTHAVGRRLLAHVFRETGRHAEAERILIELIREFPGQSEHYIDYATVLMHNLRFDKAGHLLDEALRIDPDAELGRFYRTVLLFAQGKASSDRTLAFMDFATSPTSRQAVVRMILVLMDAGRLRDARELARELALRMPDDESVLDLFRQLAVSTHPLMVPLRPFLKHGYVRYAMLYVGMLCLVFPLVRAGQERIAFGFVVLVLTFIVYSWVVPPLVRWRIKRRYG